MAHAPHRAGVGSRDAVVRPLDPDALFRRYASYVARVALRIVGRAGDVEDVVQDVFALLLSKPQKAAQVSSVRLWLAAVTVNCARSALRRRQLRRLLHLEDVASGRDTADPGASPEVRTMVARIYEALETLPVADRIAWTLRYLEGERLEDVAAIVGCSLATAKRRIHAAQTVMKRVVDHE
jgi:RNA polymerase sigma-70 factor (ECF subfamily)